MMREDDTFHATFDIVEQVHHLSWGVHFGEEYAKKMPVRMTPSMPVMTMTAPIMMSLIIMTSLAGMVSALAMKKRTRMEPGIAITTTNQILSTQ